MFQPRGPTTSNRGRRGGYRRKWTSGFLQSRLVCMCVYILNAHNLLCWLQMPKVAISNDFLYYEHNVQKPMNELMLDFPTKARIGQTDSRTLMAKNGNSCAQGRRCREHFEILEPLLTKCRHIEKFLGMKKLWKLAPLQRTRKTMAVKNANWGPFIESELV